MQNAVTKLACFKAYDIRGKLGDELNDDIAYRIGRAYGELIKPEKVVVGADMRLSSASLKQAVSNGLLDAGVDVIDLGMTGTEEIYFATSHLGLDGGIEVTASHNPIDYNGLKLVREQSRPISADNGLKEIEALVINNQFPAVTLRGNYSQGSVMLAYVEHLLSYIDLKHLKPLKVVVNAGNGSAGHVIDALEQKFIEQGVPLTFIKIHHQPDGTFPNGIPNPLLPECRQDTIDAVITHQADLGIAWDGDFDRCFFFDERGSFVEGYYIVGMLAEALLAKSPGSKIIYDPRLTWNSVEVITQAGGIPIQCKAGHSFIKDKMREEDAIYGGEMSAHHYFRDFAYCDSGMIPWLLMVALISQKETSLSELLNERIAAYPSSGEINSKVADAEQVINQIRAHYKDQAVRVDEMDGVGIEMEQWRFNLRSSNTEPLLRLNVESRMDKGLMQSKTRELLEIIRGNKA
jgi:phosphomannomutase